VLFYLSKLIQHLNYLSNGGIMLVIYFAKFTNAFMNTGHCPGKKENNMKKKKRLSQKKRMQNLLLICLSVILLLIAILIIIFASSNTKEESPPEIITVSTLEKIINVSELSTYTSVYNGVAIVRNEKDIDYYVSYNAEVKAGINLDNVEIDVDNENKSVIVDIPIISITDIIVDISSLDFIFYNEKANTSTVTEQAYKACENDVKQESEQTTEIYNLAKQNAINVLTALLKPIIEQMDSEYKLVIQ